MPIIQLTFKRIVGVLGFASLTKKLGVRCRIRNQYTPSEKEKKENFPTLSVLDLGHERSIRVFLLRHRGMCLGPVLVLPSFILLSMRFCRFRIFFPFPSPSFPSGLSGYQRLCLPLHN